MNSYERLISRTTRRTSFTADMLRQAFETAGVPDLLARLQRVEAENARLREADAIVRELARLDPTRVHDIADLKRRARVYVEREAEEALAAMTSEAEELGLYGEATE